MLTDAKLRQTKPCERAYKLADSGGLFLLITPNGSRYWRWKYRYLGKEKLLALGVYPEVSLSTARSRRDDARAALQNGGDPSGARKIEKQQARVRAENTFEVIAREWIETRRPQWIASHTERVTRALEIDAFPTLGSKPIAEITAPEVLTILRAVERRNALDVAHRLAQRVACVFRHAVLSGRITSNPASDLQGVLKTRKVEHRAALPRNELPEFLHKLKHYDGRLETKLAIRLLMLTFVRTGEMRGAYWEEIDFDRAEWRIPGERMKMGEEHVVPLAKQTLEVLQELKAVTGWSSLIFPSVSNGRKPMSENTVLYALYRMGYHKRATGHGFRALASTCLNEMGHPPHVIEAQLAHAKRDKIAAAYNRATYIPERRKLMQVWANFLDTQSGSNVVSLRKRARG